MTALMTNPITNDSLAKKKKGERIVEEHTEKEYYVCGKKTNRNVWELQQIYESTQAKTTEVLPEFVERIRFMVVQGIRKATYAKSIDQNGEMFNVVMEELLNKIVPKLDPKTNQLTTRYNKDKTNLGAYILNSCYWSVVAYQNGESFCESQVSCGDFMEDYEKVSEKPIEHEVSQLKFISGYDSGNSYLEIIQSLL